MGRGRGRADWEACRRGRIPWSVAEFKWMMRHAGERLSQPHDDWDRRPRRITILDADGEGRDQTLRLNVDHPGVQTAMIFEERYRDKPLPVVTSYSERFQKMVQFIVEHTDELRTGGWIVDAEDSDAFDVADTLLEVLVTSPYEQKVPGEEGEWTFHFAAVMKRAETLRRNR